MTDDETIVDDLPTTGRMRRRPAGWTYGLPALALLEPAARYASQAFPGLRP